MGGLSLAIRFLTRLPAPGAADANLGRAAEWFPLVGLLVGAIVAVAWWLGGTAGPWVGAVFALVSWVAVTGALHLDGLGDVADGIGAAHGDPARLLAVMKDPHIGGFGVVAVALQIAAKLVLIAHVPSLFAVVLIPAWGRWGALATAVWLPALSGGLGALFAAGAGRIAAILWAVVLLVISLVIAPALVAAPLVIGAIALYWRHRLGGVTGDVLGAGIEISETLMLVAVVMAGTV